MPKQPMQQMQFDDDGVLRFHKNAIVRFLADTSQFDMNKLAVMPFTDEDRMQFAQLIGYSVDGYHELSYVSDKSYEESEAAAQEIRKKKKRSK